MRAIAAAVLLVAVSTPAFPAISFDGPLPEFDVELIITNANVYTPNGWVEAVAIGDGVILAVGDAEILEAMKAPSTQVVDAEGSTVLPGIHDLHVHPMLAGMEQFACAFPQGASPSVISRTVAKCVGRSRPGSWVQGGNWVAAVFEPGEQDRHFLDLVAPDNPVVLLDESHHSAWVNSNALEKADITADTPDPDGGIIERDPDGEPTGLLRETAASLVADVIPPPSQDRKRQALILAANQMLSQGITTFTDAYATAAHIGTLAELSAAGDIKQRIRACLFWARQPVRVNIVSETLINARAAYASPRFSPDCVKMMLDGVPTESQTAAMLSPYAGKAASGAPAKGLLMTPQHILEEATARFDRQGLHIKFHAVGDAAVRSAIDAVAAARAANGAGGPIHDVAHASFVDPTDIPRAVALNVAWEFSPYIWYPTPMVDVDIRQAVGEERMRRFIPIRDALDTGALVVVGSDWSVVPSVNPWLAMETLVTRREPGGGKALNIRQQISREDAFRIMTENGARLMGHRDRVGTIEPGMRADLIVTKTNPFTVPITEVHRTKVLMTFIDGELVYDAASPPKLTAY